jgi:RHH-type rel operon transcriptional repressor/antitoxin RelB
MGRRRCGMVSVEIDPEINRRLEALGATTDKSKVELARTRLLEALDEDLADVRLAIARMENPGRRWSQDELEQELGLDG